MAQITVTIEDALGEMHVLTNGAAGQNLMELARANGIAGIWGDCGGNCACATCHVYVADSWWPRVGEPEDVEFSMLDLVADSLCDTSRLACQITLRSELSGLEVSVAPAAKRSLGDAV